MANRQIMRRSDMANSGKKSTLSRKTAAGARRDIRKPDLGKVLDFVEADHVDMNMFPEPVPEGAVPQPAIRQEETTAAPGHYPSPSVRSFLPNDDRFQAILQRRAKILARPLDTGQADRQQEVFLRFRLGEHEEYGIPYSCLEEILYVPSITPVPCTPAHIAGIVNRRGDMLAVLNLHAFLHIPRKDQDRNCHIAVVSGKEMQTGILADDIIGNDVYEPEHLAPPLASAGVSRPEYILGIHAGTVTMLDMAALLNDAALIVRETL